jgi:hypothetical protein
MPLSSTAELLVSGGDERIALDPATGRNKYGCHPLSAPNLIAFGSSTSSGISPGALAVVDALRERLAAGLVHQPPERLYRQEMERLRHELLQLCGIDAGSGVGLVFAASGTDVHLLAARVAASDAIGKTLVIMAGESESGSGVRAALAGRHFGRYSALGHATVPGESISDEGSGEIVDVPIRAPDGTPLDAAVVDAEIESLVNRAVGDGRQVLLVLMDVSKTGCIAPSISCVMHLHRRWGSAVQVLVDACQFRIEAATVQAYLRNAFMVALTGSKFLTGPSFSGALLLPPGLGTKLRGASISAELRGYSACEEWPADWACGQTLASHANFGLLARWQAAIHEMREFCSVPVREVEQILRRFAEAVQQRLHRDPCFVALPVPALDRASLGGASSWDGIQTIHPFLLCRPAGHGSAVPLSRDETADIHRRLGAPMGDAGEWAYQIGQPVDCGRRSGVPVSALRMCMSARLVVQAARERDLGAGVIGRAMACLDAIAEMIPAPASVDSTAPLTLMPNQATSLELSRPIALMEMLATPAKRQALDPVRRQTRTPPPRPAAGP